MHGAASHAVLAADQRRQLALLYTHARARAHTHTHTHNHTHTQRCMLAALQRHAEEERRQLELLARNDPAKLAEIAKLDTLLGEVLEYSGRFV